MHFVSYIILINVIAIFNPAINALPTIQDEQESLSDMIERDLRSRDISQQLAILGTKVAERINNFETKYVERITALETKLELYIQGWENKNNALAVVANMMKVVMKIQEQIKHTENQLDDEIKKIAETVTNANYSLSTKLETMSNEKDQHLFDIDVKVQEINDTFFTASNSLLRKFDALETISNENNDMNTNITDILSDRVRALEDRTMEKVIAFTAGIPQPETYSSQQIIKFTKVITNVGRGFNASDGIFYCPEPGLYYFFVNIMSRTNNAYAEIHKNDKLVMYVYSDGSGSNWKSGSNAVILHLNIGDKVSVKSNRSSYFDPEATHFSGYKI